MAQRKLGIGWGGRLLVFLVAIAAAIAAWRFGRGIGAVSNLNQGYPWGFWIAFDVLAGIALAAGGFVIAAWVHLFGGKKYHPLVRPAILTAFLGYLLFIASLLVDIGRPWAMWKMMVFWHHESPMFEVGWCVMSYTTVLGFEFIPAVLERLGLKRLQELWFRYSPWVGVGMVVLFATALTQSLPWVLVIAAALVGFQLLIQAGLVALDRRVPTVLILAGVIFSTLHQSSLGTVFLMAPRKLSPIWYSPMLPVIFLVSAVMTGMAMVIVEATLSARYFRREPETELLRGVGRALLVTLGLFLTLRTVDLVARGAAAEVLALSPQAFAFWLEFGLGLILPLAILASARAPVPLASLFWSSALVVVGLVIHRFNVVVTGYGPDYFGASYRPHWMEVAISVGAIAAGILIYGLACRHLPILETHPGRSEA